MADEIKPEKDTVREVPSAPEDKAVPQENAVLRQRTSGAPSSFGDPVLLFFRRLFVLQLALTIYLSYKLAQLWFSVLATKTQRDDPVENEKIWEVVHERNAKRAYRAIVGLQGLWIKAGQYISTRADIIPTPYVALLKSLQDQVPSKPVDITLSTICSELKIESLDEVFDEFDTTPLATASIAQVHRAVLKPREGPDGWGRIPVVVKVQHANIQKRVLQDLQDLRAILKLVGRFEPDYDLSPIVDEWAREVPKELDFVIEARNTTEIRDAIAAHNKNGAYPPSHPLHVDCGFADPIPPLVTEKVMVMTYINGYKIMDREGLEKENVDMAEIVTNVIKAYAFQIYVIGFWNSDPHPGNFLVAKQTESGKFIPILLDFGLTKRATRQEVIALSRILLSAQQMDFAGLMSGLQEIGIGVAAEVDPERSMDVIQFIFRKTASVEDSKVEVAERRKKIKEYNEQDKERKKAEEREAKKQGGPIAKKPTDAIPGVLVFFSRVVALLRGLCVSLETKVEYLGTMAPFAKHFLETSTADSRFGLLDKEPLRPALSPTEDRVRSIARDAIAAGRALGLQVAVFKDGKLVVDVCAGVLGTFDPRPVEPDSLFPVFSCTKAITAAVCHRLIQQGKLRLSDKVVEHWPEFASVEILNDPLVQRAKATITVADLLAHRSGLPDAGSDRLGAGGDAFTMTNFDEMVKAMESAKPTSPPGESTAYHYLSYGWLVGGLVQKVIGRPFGEVAREMLDEMGVGGYGYIGIPGGVESRLAALHWEASELRSIMAAQLNLLGGQIDIMSLLERMSGAGEVNLDVPISNPMAGGSAGTGDANTGGIMGQLRGMLPRQNMAHQAASRMRSLMGNPMLSNPTFFNHLRVRRSVIPAASGNFSARGLSLFYAHLLACENYESTGPSLPEAVPAFPLKVASAPVSKKPKSTLKSLATKRPKAETESSRTPSPVVDDAEGKSTVVRPLFGKDTILAMRTPPPLSPDVELALEGKPESAAAKIFGAGFQTYKFEPEQQLKGQLSFEELRGEPTLEATPSAVTVVSAPSPSDPALPPAGSRKKKAAKVLTTAFGHSGMGGSFGMAHPASGVAVAVVINKISLVDQSLGREILQCIADDLGMGKVVGFGTGAGLNPQLGQGARKEEDGDDDEEMEAEGSAWKRAAVTMNPFR
ncbi:hypothetical protein HDU96_007178 [Phlyctochytrium bullatum]|nr:hypothetical protein HDU96_007178 [Phlyctochytrium bullatum]